MTDRLTLTLALAVFTAAACGEAEPSLERTDETTATLLAAQGATPIEDMPAGALPPGSPRVAAPQETIDVASLGFNHGVRTAPVRVVEMSDYGCGYCRRFHMETWPVIQREFVETGKVEWKFLPFVNGMFRNSPAATEAAECVLEQDPELFIRVNSTLWERQSEWKNADAPEPMLREWVEDLGADMEQFDSCILDGRRQRRVAAAGALSRQLGVRGTPTFFVVGYPPIQGALPTETFQQILNLVYEEASGSGGG